MSGLARRLIVMRHAKSSWGDPGMPDHERPLNDRGRRSAPKVAEYLARIDWQPDFVLSSDAQRTRETWALMHDAFEQAGASIDCQFSRGLYLAGYTDVLEESACVADDVGTLLVLGHNPGWEGLVQTLSGSPVTLKTANAALLVGEGDTWQGALSQRGSWRLAEQVVSRELTD